MNTEEDMYRATIMLLQNHTAIHFQILFIYITPQEPHSSWKKGVWTPHRTNGIVPESEEPQTWSKLCNIQKKGKFPLSLREPFPEGLRVAEKEKILWVLTAMNSISAFLKVVSYIKI